MKKQNKTYILRKIRTEKKALKLSRLYLPFARINDTAFLTTWGFGKIVDLWGYGVGRGFDIGITIEFGRFSGKAINRTLFVHNSELQNGFFPSIYCIKPGEDRNYDTII